MSTTPIEILLIEDNANDAEMTLRALRKVNPGFNFVHVNDGVEALNFLFGKGVYAGRDTHQQPRLILLDLKMPKVDGLQVLNKIKTEELTKKIPVVVLTSSNESRDIEKSYMLGANSYIVKPVDFESYKKVISGMGSYWLVYNQAPM